MLNLSVLYLRSKRNKETKRYHYNTKQVSVMKKAIISSALALAAVAAAAQNGRFDVIDAGTFKVHVYYSNDALGNASFIVEGKKGLVLMEVPLFKDMAAEFDAYVKAIGKNVETVITDYHLGGSGSHTLTMPEGMPAFIDGPVYSGMMKGFKQNWGDAMVDLPNAPVVEVEFGKKVKLVGVEFVFNHGAASDFPGASIIIGKKVYFTHWAPAKAHISPLQVSSKEAVDAEIAATEAELESGAKYFIGGHGGEAARDAVEFKLSYLKTVKELLEGNHTIEGFVKAMNAAYPSLAGEDNLAGLAAALYK